MNRLTSITLVGVIALGLVTTTVSLSHTVPVASAPIVIKPRVVIPLPPINIPVTKTITKTVVVHYNVTKTVVVPRSGENEVEVENG